MDSLTTGQLPYESDISEGPPESILAGIYRSILRDLAVERRTFWNLINRYISKSMSGMSADSVSSTQTNNRNDFLRTSMTWKVWMKGFHILSVKKIDITTKLVIIHNGVEKEAKADHTIELKRANIVSEKILEQYNEDLGTILSLLRFDFGFTPEEFHAILKQHAMENQDEKLSYEKAKAKQHSAKTMLLSKKPSWKTFIKCLYILNVKRLEIGVKLYHRNGKQTTHGREVNFG